MWIKTIPVVIKTSLHLRADRQTDRQTLLSLAYNEEEGERLIVRRSTYYYYYSIIFLFRLYSVFGVSCAKGFLLLFVWKGLIWGQHR